MLENLLASRSKYIIEEALLMSARPLEVLYKRSVTLHCNRNSGEWLSKMSIYRASEAFARGSCFEQFVSVPCFCSRCRRRYLSPHIVDENSCHSLKIKTKIIHFDLTFDSTWPNFRLDLTYIRFKFTGEDLPFVPSVATKLKTAHKMQISAQVSSRPKIGSILVLTVAFVGLMSQTPDDLLTRMAMSDSCELTGTELVTLVRIQLREKEKRQQIIKNSIRGQSVIKSDM